ncbi:hypothetical protein H7J07_05975 [Mycobacterium koreense]|uniref:hypothetical protein n=1 Tax=Mycolicibacillus koreensis TaxID=1069220 RepID=UPI0013D5C9DE|nr:hypothetical protein [Mycolicibacillus koreensis]MCV7247774.1 hypothetical protein [Mycolicibacillus koreensis]
MAHYRDAQTKAPLHDGALERRYLDFIDAGNVGVSFADWLRGEIADDHIEAAD